MARNPFLLPEECKDEATAPVNLCRKFKDRRAALLVTVAVSFFLFSKFLKK